MSGRKLIVFLFLLYLGTPLSVAMHHWREGPPPGKRSVIRSSHEEPSEQDDPTSSGIPEGLDQAYYDLKNWRIGPPPGKRFLEARNFIRAGKVWKRVMRQRFDKDS